MLATERKHESQAEKCQHCVLEACTGGSFQLSRAEQKQRCIHRDTLWLPQPLWPTPCKMSCFQLTLLPVYMCSERAAGIGAGDL